MFKATFLSTLIATQAAANCASDAMIVFDGSSSMSAIDLRIETPRIKDARKAIRRALPQVEQFRNIGLITYGPGPKDGCSNIELRLAPQPDAALPIIMEIDALTPNGMTPLTASVERAANALDYRNKPATIVLVTDGNETCGGTPCALGRTLNAHAQDLTIHVIGFKFRFDFFGWNNPEQDTSESKQTVAKCLADETQGTYSSPESVEALVDALNATLGCALIGTAPRITEHG